jgi:hypothetical protein
MIEIFIDDIHREYIDDEFKSFKIRYRVLMAGELIRTVTRYIDDDLSYNEMVNFIKTKEEGKPVKTYTKSLIEQNELKEIIEIKDKEEEF